MKLLIVFQFINYMELAVSDKNTYVAEYYYWRDFYGDIPIDAYPAALDLSGRPIYIGQSYFQGFGEVYVVPGQIFTGTNEVLIEMGYEEHKGVLFDQILCTVHPRKLMWVSTNKDAVENLRDAWIIRGGFQPNVRTSIGRGQVRGTMLVGKVNTDTYEEFLGFFSTMDNRTVELNKYEILTTPHF